MAIAVPSEKKLTYLLRATVYDFARSGNAVIVGRGGQALLKQIPGTLHVRITAPLEIRIRRLMDQGDYDEQLARRVILSNDHESSGFISSFFNIDWKEFSREFRTSILRVSKWRRVWSF